MTAWPEAISAALVAALSSASIAAWVVAWPGLPLMPAVALLVALVCGVATLAALRPLGGSQWTLAAWLAVIVGTAVWLSTFAAPGWMPPGNLGDLTHHLMLIDVLDRTRLLVPNTPEAAAALGEMAHYTPGFHLLAVLVGAWSGAGALAVVYPLIVAMAALKAGLIFLIARIVTAPEPQSAQATRSTAAAPSTVRQTLLPVIAVAFVLCAPTAYTVNSFILNGFLAQVAAELFAVAGWWSVTAWCARPRPVFLGLAGIFAAATFLTWPIWIGPLLLVGVASIATAPASTVRERTKGLVLLVVPFTVVASMHVSQHWRSLAIAGTNGWVPSFAPGPSTWVLIGLAAAALVLTWRSRRVRPVAWFLGAIAVQAAALYVAARTSGAETPYMAMKMMYLAVYPLAVLAAVAIDRATGVMPRAVATGTTVTAAALIALMGARMAASAPAAPLMVSADLVSAGRWARASLPAPCVDYIVRDAETAYWLHLAVLGQPRSTSRTAAIDGYTANRAVGNWIVRRGLPYAVAEAVLLPPEVRETTTVLHRVGDAVVIQRTNAGDSPSCEVQ